MKIKFTINQLLLIIFLTFFSTFIKAQSGYKLIWSDEFNDTTLDLSKWSYEIGNNNGWGNGEWEYYTSRTQNVNVKDSVLTISAIKESYSGFNYTSGRIKTQNKFSFKYGKVEARIKLPYGKGMWPAFWLLGDNIVSVGWPSCGENDIMEMIGGNGIWNNNLLSDSTVYGTAHWSNNGAHAQYGKSYTLKSGKFSDGYHIFSVIWNSRQIVWYCDGTAYCTLDITSSSLSAFQNKFFIILNLAVGGAWPGYPDNTTVFPQTMKVDYVRVYQDTTAFPYVSITSPSSNSTFNPNSNITLTSSASTPSGTISKVEFFQDAAKIGQSFISPYEMTWNNVQSGNYRITSRVYTTTGLTAASDTIKIKVGNSTTTSPYGGTPWQVPGTIEAENFDLGGQGEAYYDTDVQNSGGMYRPLDGVDIESCSDANGGYDVGWTQNGEWLAYTIEVSDTGSYTIGARVSSTAATGVLHFEVDGNDVTGSMNVPNTGGWQTWTTIQSKNFNLNPGLHHLKLLIDAGNFNINYFDIYHPNTQPSINLIYPEGGENFNPGDIVNIKWGSQKINQVLIGFSTNGGKTWSLVQSGVDSKFGIYRWLVPSVNSANCMIKIVNKDNLSLLDTTKSPFTVGQINSVNNKAKAPQAFSLDQNYPNPFNPSTTISFYLPAGGNTALKVFDIYGKEVKNLITGYLNAGRHNIKFNADKLSSGVYFYRLETNNLSFVKKMILMK